MKKGQLNLSNYVVLFFIFILILALNPVINTIIEASVVGLSAHPSDMTPLVIAIMRLIPFTLIACCIITAVYWAIPKREGVM